MTNTNTNIKIAGIITIVYAAFSILFGNPIVAGESQRDIDALAPTAQRIEYKHEKAEEPILLPITHANLK